jgi:hypothetical protein
MGPDSPFFPFLQAGFLKMQPLSCQFEGFADGIGQAGTAMFCWRKRQGDRYMVVEGLGGK